MTYNWLVLLNSNEPWSLFTLEAQTFIQMIPHMISFGLLALIFVRFLYRPVKNILQTRANRIESDLTQAEESRLSAQAMEAEYATKLKDIEAERAAILEEARKEANERLALILGEAKTEAENTRLRTQREIVAEQERVKAQIHQAIIDISTNMAEKLVAATISPTDHSRLFNDAMVELENTTLRSY